MPKGRTFSLTDMVFQNPKGGAGTLTVARKVGADTQVLFKSELANFRDFDLHFVSPFVFPSESSVVLTIECTSTCNDVAVTFSGTER